MITKAQLLKIEKLLKDIRDVVAGGEYIFRGETRKRGEVSSKLYRELKKNRKRKISDSDIKAVLKERLADAKKHTKEEDDNRILEELQHLGGSTNQIDFTTDYLIALFFACDGEHNKSDGRLIFLDKIKFKEQIHEPRHPQNRVIAQKSVFVRSPSGLVEPDKTIPIDMGLKEFVLRYLSQHHGINAQTIYNDIHGYITQSEIHKIAREKFYLGLLYQNKRKHKLAIRSYTKALEYDPSFNAAYNNRGLAYDNKGEHDLAIEDYNKAIELNPDYALAYVNRSIAYNKKNNTDRAIADCTKAIELNPKYVMAYNNRGNIYRNKEEHDLAIADFSKVIELNPKHVQAYNSRSNTYNKKGEYDLAIADCNKIIELDMNYVGAYGNRGIAKEALQDHKGAREDYETTLRLAKQQGNKTIVDIIQKAITRLPAALEK